MREKWRDDLSFIFFGHVSDYRRVNCYSRRVNNYCSHPTCFLKFLWFPSFTCISNLASQDALDRGMVLVMSLWDDAEANMLWLDSDYPADKSPSIPGVNRGPCARDTGKPSFLRSKFPDARVTYSEIKVRDREVKQIFGKWKMWGLTKKMPTVVVEL